MKVLKAALIPVLTFALLSVLNLSSLPGNSQGTPGASVILGEETRISVGPNQGAFLILTDIHFDPFADRALVSRLASSPVEQWLSIFQSSPNQTLTRDASDTNFALQVSAIKAAKDSADALTPSNNSPAFGGVPLDYVVVDGDYLAHNFRVKFRAAGLDDADYQAFAVKTMVFVSRMIQQAFPKTPVVAALGNNDSTCDDYNAPGGALLAALAKEWKTVAAHPDAAGDFVIRGNYAIPHPTLPKQELIVLNTNFWSSNYRGGCYLRAGDPGALELRWLQGKLRDLQRAGKTATLIMHIPPGIDGYASARQADCNKPTSLWKQQYADAFLKTLETYKGILRDAYAAHVHHDDFRILADGGTPFLQVHIAPSISPIYGNNPAFEVGLYDKASGALQDYTVVYLRNYFATNATGTPPGATSVANVAAAPPDWKNEYDFRRAYGSEGVSPTDLKTVAGTIRSDPDVRAKFSDFYDVQSTARPDITAKNWQSFSCAQTEITPGDFSRCVCPASEVTK